MSDHDGTGRVAGSAVFGTQDSPVCVIGMGYVGLPLALRLVAAGFEVWGVERAPDTLGDLRQGDSHVHEPGMPGHLRAALDSGRFHLVADIPADVAFKAYLISVGTPLDQDGSVNFTGVEAAARQIVVAARPGALVMLRSTVSVGTTRNVVRPILDGVAGIELAFCPERTLQGRAFDELATLPQIVGGETPHALARASRFFHDVTPCVVEVSSLETAEMIKLCANTFRDITFAFANEAARLCDAVGISATEVVRAGGVGYPRGTMPRPGPVGGSCLTKDPGILMYTFHSFGLATPGVIAAARRENEGLPVRAADDIHTSLYARGFAGELVTAVLGIAFKGVPETGDVRGSQSVELIEALRGYYPLMSVRAHDRVSTAHEAMRYQRCDSVSEAVRGAHVLVIGNDHPSYAALDLAGLVAEMAQPAVVYDLWGMHKADAGRMPPGVAYFAPGEGLCATTAGHDSAYGEIADQVA